MGTRPGVFIHYRREDNPDRGPDFIFTGKKGDERKEKIPSTMIYEIPDMLFMILLIIIGLQLIIDNKI